MPTQPAVEGVRSRPLTAPWKDMKLSIDGGVVVNSTSDNLIVRFPVIHINAAIGLFRIITDELIVAGFKGEGEQHFENAHEMLLRDPDGKPGLLSVTKEKNTLVLSINTTGR